MILNQEQREKRLGRPSSYTDEAAARICSRLADGESLRSICRDNAEPCAATVFKWLRDYESFAKQYAHARELQAEFMAEEILAIADESAADTYIDESGVTKTNSEVVARSKLRVDARKWLASKLLPKKYGDRIAVGGAEDMPPVKHEMSIHELARRAAYLFTAGVEAANEPQSSLSPKPRQAAP